MKNIESSEAKNAFIFNLPVRRVPAVKPKSQVEGFQFRMPRCGYEAHGFMRDANDCTVRAVMAACRIDYPSAHDLLKRAGRKDRKGFRLAKVQRQLGLIPLDIHRGSVRKVLAGLPKSGRYVFKVPHHVFAVADGMIFDSVEQIRRHVRQVWRSLGWSG